MVKGLNTYLYLTNLDKYKDQGIFILRLVLGIVFIVHGWVKLFVVGVSGVGGFLGNMGIPFSLAAGTAVSVLEFAGGIMLIIGLLTRWVSLLLAIEMFFAYYLVHRVNGFFIGVQFGYEFVFVLFGALVALLLHGPSMISLDAKYSNKGKRLKK